MLPRARTPVPKILLLYDKQGNGHQERARILQEILDSSVEAEVISVAGSELLGASSVTGIVALWNYLLERNLCRTADVLINFFTRLIPLPIIEACNIDALMEKLEAIHPDLIISTADGFNKSVGQYAQRVGIPFYAVLTEISVFLDNVSITATHLCYFQETEDALRSFDVRRAYFAVGLDKDASCWDRMKYVLRYFLDYWPIRPGNRLFHDLKTSAVKRNDLSCRVIGPLVDEKHFCDRDRLVLREKLAIPASEHTLLIASGSIGGRYVQRIVESIARHATGNMHIFVLCGRDAETHRILIAYASCLDTIRLVPLEFVDNVDEYMAVADCVVARSSAGILAESLVHHTPFITFRLTTTNDIGSVQLIEKHGLGEICANTDDLAATLAKVLQNKVQYVERIDAFLKRYPSTFAAMADTIVDLIRKDLPCQCGAVPLEVGGGAEEMQNAK